VVPPNWCFGFKIILTINETGWNVKLASDQNHYYYVHSYPDLKTETI
jgi:hypothetical protein